MVIPDLSTDRAVPSHKAWHAWHGVRAATHESLALLVSTVWSIRGLPCMAAAWHHGPDCHGNMTRGREEHRIHMAPRYLLQHRPSGLGEAGTTQNRTSP